MQTDYAILGGGLAGLSMGAFLTSSAVIIERESTLGGLSRSYSLNGVAYDIGPHIIFSKNAEVLELHSTMIPTNKLRRSNKILFHGRLLKYPFENDLSSLSEADRDYCLHDFLNNPYEDYSPTNMLQFFLSTFGEGITRLYLQPYNEKIWKFDPSCMDTQMVERIPKPPKEDVIASAKGISTEGYTHQLYYHYPQSGGFQTLIDAYRDKALANHAEIRSNTNIKSIEKTSAGWEIHTDQGVVEAKNLINCMPIHELAKLLPMPSEVAQAISKLLYNSIYIAIIQVKKDKIGDHFALYVPDKDVIFHRVSKLDFLGDSYHLADGGSTLMAEVTFRPDSYLSSLSRDTILELVIDGLVNLDLIDRADVLDTAMRYEKYAYVIYDVDHRKNADTALNYLSSQGIRSVGRFAEFEYLNSDGVVEHTLKLARELNEATELVG